MGIMVICMVHNNYRTFQRLTSKPSKPSRTPSPKQLLSSSTREEIEELYHDHNVEEIFSLETAQIVMEDTHNSNGAKEGKFTGPGTLWVDEIEPNTFGEGLEARVYRSWSSDKELPCFEAEPDWKSFKRQNNGIMQEGFMFQRPFKCGSTSSIGMVLRFLYKLAKSKGFDREMCRVRFDHGWNEPKWAKRFQNRERAKSYLWSILRDPTPRTISQYYFFAISHGRQMPTDEHVLNWLRKTKMVEDYYARTLLTDYQYPGRDGKAIGVKNVKAIEAAINAGVPIPDADNADGDTDGDKDDVADDNANMNKVNNYNYGLESMKTVMEEYDFIGITERFDESAVALSMLLNIPLGDILYLSIKQSGGFDYAWNECMYIVKPYISPKMRAYFDSQEWKDKIKYDAALYRAANRSLDMTIDHLGSNEFYHNLNRFQKALKIANKNCADSVLHLCTEGGQVVPRTRHDCLWDNAACGMSCLDGVAKQLKLEMTE